VTCAVVVSLLIVGILVAIKLVTDSNNERLKIERQFRNGETLVDESLYQDKSGSSRLLQYHLKSGSDIETWVLDDLIKGVRIIKITHPLTQVDQCYIQQYTPVLNETSQPASDNSPDTNAVNKIPINETTAWFRVSQQPINGILSLVNDSAKQFCDSLQMYMLYSQDNTKPMTSVRRKRSYRYCYTNWLQCRTFHYPDHPEKQYFGCDIVCVQV
jgi:hypothetical protein